MALREGTCDETPFEVLRFPLSIWNWHFVITDIEQVLREKKPFILCCMLDGIKKLQERMVKWHRCALRVSITWA